MQISSATDQPDQDETIRVAEAQRDPDGWIHIRIQPQVLLTTPEGRRLYLAWRDVYWVFKVQTAAEAYDLRDALVACFAAVGKFGATAVKESLDGAVKGMPSSRPHTESESSPPSV